MLISSFLSAMESSVASGRLRKKDGVWVFRSEEPLTEEIVERTAREIRRERDERIWGKRS